MYLRDLTCGCNGKSGLRGLAFIETLLPIAGKILGGSSGGGSAQPSISNSVRTDVTTTVSPQISPSFVQQSNPNSSPVNTSAVQGTPVTGAMPGFDSYNPYPAYAPQSAGMDTAQKVLLLGAAGALVVAIVAGRRKRSV